MKDPLQTLLEIISHITNQHPNLAAHARKIVRSVGGEDPELASEEWARRSYDAPSPHFVKQAVLLRNNLSDATWVETGTFLGDTTEFLSRSSLFVHTIEPEASLYAKATHRFSGFTNVMVHHATSETALPSLLPKLSGNVCFWLDGHYSGGNTFAGPNDTPLRIELKVIAENLHRFSEAVVLVDDIRLCGKLHAYGEYPSLNELIDFANSNNFIWYIEHDILILRHKPK
jgi:hypothetical protein